MYLAQNLKYLRQQNGEQLKELAQLLNISESTMSKYENGFIELDIKKIVVISKHYKISLDDLVLKDLRPPIPQYVKNFLYLRMKHGMSQEDMGNLLGVTQRCVSKYEKGECNVNVEKLMKIADSFGITLDQLVRQDLSKGDIQD